MIGCNCVVDSCVRLLYNYISNMYACTFAPFFKSDVSSKPIKFAAWTLTISMHQNHSQSGHILPVPVWLYGGSAYAPSKYLKDKLIIELYVTILYVIMYNCITILYGIRPVLYSNDLNHRLQGGLIR